MLKRASINEIPVSEAPTTTILEFFKILGSESNLLVVKQRVNLDSASSSGSLSWPSSFMILDSSSVD